MLNWSDGAKISLPITLLVIIVITILLTALLKNKSQKLKNLPFMVIAGIMLVMEVIKQVLTFMESPYSLWNIPLHFCSLFMLWFSIAAFAKGKWKELGFTLSVVSAYLFLVTFYISPHTIIGYSTDNIFANFSAFHTYSYHHFIILFTFLAIALKQFKPNYRQIKPTVLVYTIYFIVAVTMAHLLDTNYVSLLHNSIAPLQHINETKGIVLYSLTMYVIGTGGAVLGIVVSKLISNLLNKRKTKKKEI